MGKTFYVYHSDGSSAPRSPFEDEVQSLLLALQGEDGGQASVVEVGVGDGPRPGHEGGDLLGGVLATVPAIAVEMDGVPVRFWSVWKASDLDREALLGDGGPLSSDALIELAGETAKRAAARGLQDERQRGGEAELSSYSNDLLMGDALPPDAQQAILLNLSRKQSGLPATNASGCVIQTDVDIFASDVDGVEDSILRDAVATAPPLRARFNPESPPRILDLYEGDPKVNYWEIDYKTALSTNGVQTRLHPEREIVKGELVRVIWYREPPEDSLGNPVPIEERTPIVEYQAAYTRHSDLRCRYRVAKRRWALANGSWGPWHTKPRKYYSGVDIGYELQRRADNAMQRQNSVGLEALVGWRMQAFSEDYATAVTYSLARADEWYIHFENEIRKFRSTCSRAFYDAVSSLPEGTLQWAHDCQFWAESQGSGYEGYRFLSVVLEEIDFGWAT